LIPLYLMHVTAVPHSESNFWISILCNLFVVTSGIVFMVKLFKQQNVKMAGITFAIAIAINYIAIAIIGNIFDLLG